FRYPDEPHSFTGRWQSVAAVSQVRSLLSHASLGQPVGSPSITSMVWLYAARQSSRQVESDRPRRNPMTMPTSNISCSAWQLRVVLKSENSFHSARSMTSD